MSGYMGSTRMDPRTRFIPIEKPMTFHPNESSFEAQMKMKSLLMVSFVVILLLRGLSADGSNCGQIGATSKIIRGKPAAPESWPWVARIEIKEPDGTYTCTGILIAPKWILTAGHCLVLANKLVVYMGETREGEKGDHVFREVIPSPLLTKKVFVHECYHNYIDNDVSLYDVGLIRLEKDATAFDRKGRPKLVPICLPTKGAELDADHKCYSTGWGVTQKPDKDPVRLRQVEVTVLSPKECQLLRLGNECINTDLVLCVRNEAEVHGEIGVGDSGGPLNCQLADKKWYAFGMLRSLAESGGRVAPSHYMKARPFYDWIAKIYFKHK